MTSRRDERAVHNSKADVAAVGKCRHRAYCCSRSAGRGGPSTLPALPRFLDDLDPELQREVFALRPAKLRPELLDVTLAKQLDIESRSSRNCREIGAVSVVVSDDLGQNQVVPFEDAEPKFLECCIESRW